MTWLVVFVFALVLLLASIRFIQPEQRAVIIRFGQVNRVAGPGMVFLLPWIEQLRRVSITPLSLSLPIQSAITKDEIPIQLQASLDAEVRAPELALKLTKDWRIAVISKLQTLMKDKLEELDFDQMDSVFEQWVQSIRSELQAMANELGVEITGLQISNLSPRTRPE